jgi:hypothetical protein
MGFTLTGDEMKSDINDTTTDQVQRICTRIF